MKRWMSFITTFITTCFSSIEQRTIVISTLRGSPGAFARIPITALAG